MATHLECIHQGESLFAQHKLFYGHGTTTAFDEAAYIVLTVTGYISSTDASIYGVDLSEENHKTILTLFNRRIAEKIPAAYLLGEAWFAGFSFFVDQSVLVPRSPFAELINNSFEPWLGDGSPAAILDLCTGSGCIGIACAMTFHNASVDLSDISLDALRVADKNISRHELQHRVKSIESSLFKQLPVKKYDLIISNPPYVGHKELNSLPEEFYKEPQLGLDGGETGLDLVHEILVDAVDYLTDGGVLFVEVGNSDETLQKVYPNIPFMWIEFEAGGHGVFMLTRNQLLKYKEQFLVNLVN